MTAPALDEVSEQAATGEIAAIYAELRACLGVPLVNLVFRNMATVPGCLPWAWACLKPLYRGKAIHRAGAKMSALARAARFTAAPADVGLPKDAIGQTLDSYIRANPINLIGLDVLLRATRGSAAGVGPGDAAQVAPIRSLLPMADIKTLPPETVARLRDLARILHGADGPVIPSVFRHFASSPAALAVIARVMADLHAGDRLTSLGAKMADHGRFAAARFAVQSPGPPNADTVVTIERLAGLFPDNMTKMTVVAVALRAALT